jgi:hypothetical protein
VSTVPGPVQGRPVARAILEAIAAREHANRLQGTRRLIALTANEIRHPSPKLIKDTVGISALGNARPKVADDIEGQARNDQPPPSTHRPLDGHPSPNERRLFDYLPLYHRLTVRRAGNSREPAGIEAARLKPPRSPPIAPALQRVAGTAPPPARPCRLPRERPWLIRRNDQGSW